MGETRHAKSTEKNMNNVKIFPLRCTTFYYDFHFSFLMLNTWNDTLIKFTDENVASKCIKINTPLTK